MSDFKITIRAQKSSAHRGTIFFIWRDKGPLELMNHKTGRFREYISGANVPPSFVVRDKEQSSTQRSRAQILFDDLHDAGFRYVGMEKITRRILEEEMRKDKEQSE